MKKLKDPNAIEEVKSQITWIVSFLHLLTTWHFVKGFGIFLIDVIVILGAETMKHSDTLIGQHADHCYNKSVKHNDN
jgi:hypothetical protein